jgi:hypothetical protein
VVRDGRSLIVPARDIVQVIAVVELLVTRGVLRWTRDERLVKGTTEGAEILS